jgi:DNA-directed RNA polymerase specialized sigma24 family protein
MVLTTVPPEVLRSARRLRAQGVESLLGACYPQVYRMAHGLCGRVDTGHKATRTIVHQAMRVLPTWSRDNSVERWFPHHTVLVCRRYARRQPKPERDVLVSLAETDDPTYIAFVAALRSLPVQQKEAFLLHHGEDLDPRELAIAMDCSVQAARYHLDGAVRSLIEAKCGDMGELTRMMVRAYKRLTPHESVLLPAIQRHMRRDYWPQRIVRMVRRYLNVIVWLVSAYGIWRLWDWVDRNSH